MSNVLKRILRNPILDFMFVLILLGTIYFPFLFVLVYAIFCNNLYRVNSKLILFLFALRTLHFLWRTSGNHNRMRWNEKYKCVMRV